MSGYLLIPQDEKKKRIFKQPIKSGKVISTTMSQ